uniref:Periplasmic heavy metal sensor n=1 Tax=Schlesneria paludicola TaxID=360056 RepID=A0A7C4QPP8_9PLAN
MMLMRSIVAKVVLTVLCVGIAAGSVAVAQDAQKKGKKNTPGANSSVFQLPKEVSLTAEQETKLDALKKEFGPKLAEVQKKLDDLLSPEQKQARKDAAAKAKSEKLKGKAAQEAIFGALKLSPEQKEKYEAAQKELQELQAKVRAKMAEFLTDEQKAKIPALAPKKKKNA